MIEPGLWPTIFGGLLVAFLVTYALTGGADFGGGVWDLLAGGSTRQKQRRLIAHSIGPIWEANHVWLIALVVVLFLAFPKAFALISNGLHLPLTIMLVGIVCRGSAFVFRKYDHVDQRDVWGLLFAIASVITPVMLGLCLANLSTGRMPMDEDGRFSGSFFTPFVQLFPWLVGLLTLCLFAFLAACYLILSTKDHELIEAFGRRAQYALGAACLTGLPALWVGLDDAPRLQAHGNKILGPILAIGLLLIFVNVWVLLQKRFGLLRFSAPSLVVTLIMGWALTHYPYLVFPELTIADGVAPASVLRPVFAVMLVGLALLIPSFWYLYRLFTFAGAPPQQK